MKLIMQSDALNIPLASGSVQCVVTSPPYWGLRDYGTAKWVGGDVACDHEKDRLAGVNSSTLLGSKATTNHQKEISYRDICGKCGAVRIDAQLGSEPLHDCMAWARGENCGDCYVCHMRQVFAEVRRVMRDDATMWLNLGDSYASDTKGSGGPSKKQDSNTGSKYAPIKLILDSIKPKDLVGIPWRVALALQADGWYLRQDIIWHKPNPMPESVQDRCTKAHEYLFLLTKSQRYYYDAEAVKEARTGTEYDRTKRAAGRMNGTRYLTEGTGQEAAGDSFGIGSETRNRRSVWTIEEDEYQQFLEWKAARTGDKKDVWKIATTGFKGAHFAVYPPALVEPCILAGSRKGDIVFDPFSGSGTTGQVAIQLGRRYIGGELSAEYIDLSKRRTSELQIGGLI